MGQDSRTAMTCATLTPRIKGKVVNRVEQTVGTSAIAVPTHTGEVGIPLGPVIQSDC